MLIWNCYHGGMPRHRRLNIPGAINHVLTRGLNRQDIFLDDCDRNDLTGGGLRRSAGGWEGVLEEIGPVFRYIPAFSLAGHQASGDYSYKLSSKIIFKA